MFEHFSKPLIPESAYHRRLIGAAGLALLVIALYSGFVALICVGVLGAPVLQRFLHRFHFDEDAEP